MEKGTPTGTKDITDKMICLGDIVKYDFEDEQTTFKVVFECNAFRKKYKNWRKVDLKPILNFSRDAEVMRLTIIKSHNEK